MVLRFSTLSRSARACGLRAVVGLGSNLGDRLATLRRAVGLIAGVAAVERRSHVYRSAPVGGPAQPEFLNAATLVGYGGSADALLAVLLGIEAELGRVRKERWGPRAIDLDLLWAEGVIVDDPDLVVPHPRLAERAFALLPMLEVAPDARDPRSNLPYVVPPGEVWRTDDVL